MSSLTHDPSALAWNFFRNPRQPYDDFVANYILKPLKFQFVQSHYDRPLADFSREFPQMAHRFSSAEGPGSSEFLAETLQQIVDAGFTCLFPFLDQVTTRARAQNFLDRTGIPQPGLMDWMTYLKGWWFPFPANLRQLVEEGDPVLDPVLGHLKTAKIANSLALLDAAAQPEKRADLARQLGIVEDILLDLVQRADVARLPFVSGGAVKRLWVMGFRSLADIRRADPDEYAALIDAYFAAGGKGSTFDARMSNILIFLQDARIAPDVVSICMRIGDRT